MIIQEKDISVVIGFKDWGVERLLISVKSILSSFGELEGEVIVSDYGSVVDSNVKNLVEDLGAKYVYTETDGKWSRSRALNAGFAESQGRVLVSTDADMLFSPSAMETIGRRVLSDPGEALVLQCRDLPKKYDSVGILAAGMDWDAFERSSTLRPRWGMGGMMAVSRATFLLLRGFDERMEIYGGEDMDFAQRVRWSGRRLSWISDDTVRMFHMWHQPTRTETSKTLEGRQAIEFNRRVVLEDKSIIRNVVKWVHKPADAKPIASVVISTKDRAEYISDSINSVLAQTVEDIEVIVIDDGSTDGTANVVQSFKDHRVKYHFREGAGIASARNYAASISLADFTVIHDDDDLMFPDRIENHFASLEAGVAGTYGGWIDFDHSTGEVISSNPGKKFSLEALLFSGKVFAHATLMVRTELIRQVGYDFRLRSGSDYNLAIRLARSGAVLVHTNHFHLIRRLHERQVTHLDTAVQKASARLISTLGMQSIRPGKQRVLRTEFSKAPGVAVTGDSDPAALILPYLPDHLVARRLELHLEKGSQLPARLSDRDGFKYVSTQDVLNRGPIEIEATLDDASWDDIVALRGAEISFTIVYAKRRADFIVEYPQITDQMLPVLHRLIVGDEEPGKGTMRLICIGSSDLFPDTVPDANSHYRSASKNESVDAISFILSDGENVKLKLSQLGIDPIGVYIELQRPKLNEQGQYNWKEAVSLVS
ncbi:glycosyltransferase [Arthrobacter sp. 260]|uniref:glycosyltransferase family 2 protein n=1 Tax=Arthrobacter sp. 260 TaxID=2735314 RepID=UPI001491DD96|nr:glycosyltransferase [Arthrobacter sp. 260]NOJ60390.1 glycosyltransferase [Arthrobacter sp. 260]